MIFFTRFKKFLLRPHPFDFSIKRITTHVVISSLSVFFILFVVQPFQINEANLPTAFFIAVSFACVCPIVIFPLEIALYKILPSYYIENNWTVLKTLSHFVLIIIFMSVGNYLMSLLLFSNDFMWIGITDFLYPTIAIGIIPITISIFFSQYKYYKKFKILGDQLNFELQEKLNPNKFLSVQEVEIDNKDRNSREFYEIKNEKSTPTIIENPVIETAINFKSVGSNDHINISPSSIIYLSAADNYVDFFFLENHKLKRVTQRNTLTNICEALKQFPFFIRCHRSYLINATMVENIFGNAQGLKLKLKNIAEEIPVSRSMHKEISKMVLHFANGQPPTRPNNN